MARKKRGVRRHGAGWQAHVGITGQPRITKTFPLSTPFPVMEAWRQQVKKQYAAAATTARAGSFGADIEHYLWLRRLMPTVRQLSGYLNEYADMLGRDRTRASITKEQIDEVHLQWLTPGTRPRGRGVSRGLPSGAGGLSNDSVRKRRAALVTMFIRLDGSEAQNPARGSFNPPATPPAERGVKPDVVLDILAAMRDVWGGRPCLNKLRATVIAYTGFPPVTLWRLRAKHIDLVHGTARVERRRKGGGVAGRNIPLSPLAVEAFRALIAADGMDRPWTTHALNTTIKRAMVKPGVNAPADFSLYDLRHSFGSQLLRDTNGSEAAVARALMHAPGSRHTHRYTLAAHAEIDAAAAATMGETWRRLLQERASRVAAAVPEQSQIVPTDCASLRKSRRVNDLRKVG